jgi:hypothetical protein
VRRIETALCVIAAALAVSGSVGLCVLAVAQQRAAAWQSPGAYHDRMNWEFGRTMLSPLGLSVRLDDGNNGTARGVPQPEVTK